MVLHRRRCNLHREHYWESPSRQDRLWGSNHRNLLLRKHRHRLRLRDNWNIRNRLTMIGEGTDRTGVLHGKTHPLSLVLSQNSWNFNASMASFSEKDIHTARS